MTPTQPVAAVVESDAIRNRDVLSHAGRVPDSDWRVLAQTTLVAALAIAVKAAGAAKTVVVAQSFGAGRVLDAYLIAFLAPSFLCDVLSGAVAPSLIPALAQARHESGYERARSLYAGALYRSVRLLGGLALILAGAGFVFTTFTPSSAVTVRLMLVLIPIMPLSAVANVWRAVLNVEGRFFVAAATPALTPLVTIGFLYAAASSPFLLAALAFGTTIGMAAEVVALGVALRRAGFPILPPAGPPDTVRPVVAQFGAVSASNLVMSGSALIDQGMAALLGPGSLSVLNYGTRLVSLLIAVGPAALSTTVLPKLSDTIAHRKWTELRVSLVRYLAVGICVAVPITAVLIWFSVPVVRLVLERGAFTAADTQAVASVQAFSLLQFPISIGIAIFTRLLASLRENQLIIPLSVAGLIGNAGFDYALMNRFGVAGIAMASTVVSAVMVAALAVVAISRLRMRARSSN